MPCRFPIFSPFAIDDHLSVPFGGAPPGLVLMLGHFASSNYSWEVVMGSPRALISSLALR